MTSGRIIKNFNGYYYVETDTGIVTCKIKGKMKQERFSKNPDGESMITKVLPRRNFMERPAMANLDCVVIAFACCDPDFSYLLADKMLAFAERAGIEAVLCLNKTDLVSEDELNKIADVYKLAGYRVFAVSTFNNTGLDELKAYLNGKISAFAGPSGVWANRPCLMHCSRASLCKQAVSAKKSAVGGTQPVMRSCCHLTAAILPTRRALAICWQRTSTRASCINISGNLKILSMTANLCRVPTRTSRSAA